MNKQISKHISNGNLKIKKKSQIGGNKIKLSPNSRSYKIYLQNGGKNTTAQTNATPNAIINKDKKEAKPEKKIQIKRKDPSKNNESTIKIIRQKENKSKHKFTRKKPSKIKDINEIEKKMELNKPKSKIEKIPKKEIVKEIVKEIETKKKDTKPKMEMKPKKEMKPKISNKRNNKRNSKRSNKRNNKKGSRKISLKHKKITEKEVEKVKNHIKDIRSKKTGDIKKELEKQGIKVSGKSNRLLKDIYLYSKVSGINIQHEK